MVVKLNSWREGMQKVTLTKIQMEVLNLGLVKAKANVDKLLNEEIVEIEVESLENAQDFVCRAQAIGVNCEIEAD